MLVAALWTEQHRAFHRDYDAPKDMSVDSILCAPIILHHRVIGVIQVHVL